MTRTLLRAAVILFSVFVIHPGMAFSQATSVVDGVHNFSTGGTSGFQSTNEDEVCIFCHTPHGGVVRDRGTENNPVPLWNRNLNDTAPVPPFTMYTSSTFDGTYATDNKPTGISLLCLSCHDGVSTINGVINYSPDGPIIMPFPDKIGDIPYPPYRDINITRDLSNDHPVSFRYNGSLVSLDTTRRGGTVGLQDPGLVSISPLQLFRDGSTGQVDRLECATCHDPHDDGLIAGRAPFLRMSNASSGMCMKCHIK